MRLRARIRSAERPTPPSTPAHDFSGDDGPLPIYRSKRLELSLPLPRGREWRIDDHSSPEFVATHPPTASRVLVAVVHADAIVGRTQCEDIARARKLLPAGPVETLADEVVTTQGSFDTRVEVVLIPGDAPNRPIVGHVMAFGGYLRKCYVFDFSTQIANAGAAATLAARLAFARARIFGGLTLDAIASPRTAPARADGVPLGPVSP